MLLTRGGHICWTSFTQFGGWPRKGGREGVRNLTLTRRGSDEKPPSAADSWRRYAAPRFGGEPKGPKQPKTKLTRRDPNYVFFLSLEDKLKTSNELLAVLGTKD